MACRYVPIGPQWKFRICFYALYLWCQNKSTNISSTSGQSKEEGKHQELMQSSITPDPGHHMGKWHNKTSHTRGPIGSPLSKQVITRLQWTDKAAWKTQTEITKRINNKWAVTWDFQQCGMCDQQSLSPACAQAQSDQRLCQSLEYYISVQRLTKHHSDLLSLIGGCTGSSESTLVKMPHCWKSFVAAQILINLPFLHCFGK